MTTGSRAAKAPSLPVHHRPPAMWAVGLSVCAHQGLGSWVSISGLGYQKTPKWCLWLPGMKGDSWGWVWWQGYFCASSAYFCESSALPYKRRHQSALKYKVFWFGLWGPVSFLVPCNFGAQPAVQQQCSCHMLICLMSFSHQKAASGGKCEAELWLHGLSRTGLSCRCERSAKQAWYSSTAVWLWVVGWVFLLWLEALSPIALVLPSVLPHGAYFISLQGYDLRWKDEIATLDGAFMSQWLVWAIWFPQVEPFPAVHRSMATLGAGPCSLLHSGFHVVTCFSRPSAWHAIMRHLINSSAALKRVNLCDKALLLVSQSVSALPAQK